VAPDSDSSRNHSDGSTTSIHHDAAKHAESAADTGMKDGGDGDTVSGVGAVTQKDGSVSMTAAASDAATAEKLAGPSNEGDESATTQKETEDPPASARDIVGV